MTDDQILEVVQGHRDGKQIQMFRDEREGWLPVQVPGWNFHDFKYRVAPEPRKPREWWAEVPSDGSVGQLFQNLSQNTKGHELVRVREVI